MSCFFSCFRISDHTTNLVSKTTEPVVSWNCLSTLLGSEEENDNLGFSTRERIEDGKNLKEEAPVELRKASEKYKDVSQTSEGLVPFRFHSWVKKTYIEMLNLEKQHTPVKFGKGWLNDEEPLQHTPGSSNQSNGAGSATDATSSTRTSSNTVVPTSEQCRNKSVRFEFDDDIASFSSTSSSSGIIGLYLKQHASGGVYSMSKPSPYSTPMKLTDEMQTPGTFFPASFDGLPNRKNPRIRSQYVYSALNPAENITQMKILKEEDYSFENTERLNLKPPSINQEGKKNIGRIHGDRIIIGLVAPQWNEKEEASCTSPKYWDGNGIQYSTNKYNEGQKVCWHAKPFEEKLEKALSNESSITLRKNFNPAPAIDFEDTDENDTVVSHLQQPSTYSKPVVSF